VPETFCQEGESLMACKVKVNRHGNLYFKVHWDGLEAWEGTSLKGTSRNRQRMEARAVLISEEIENGTFDYLKYFPQGNKAHLFRGKEFEVERKTIRDYFEEWMLDKLPPLFKKSRVRKYRSHFRAYILKEYGGIYLDKFNFTHIKDLRTRLVGSKGLSVRTAKNAINGSLRAFFRDAKLVGLINQSPFDAIPRDWWPKTVLPPIDPFTEDERDEIIKFMFNKHWARWPSGYAFLYTLFWTGARPSELTARRWRDLDLRTGLLSIHSSLTEREESATKTPASFRTITLDEGTLDYLSKIKPLRVKPDDYIFTQRNGNPINTENFSVQYFQGALSVLKIRHRDFYHTRHTFISAQLTYGENPQMIAEYVGTSVAMIFSRYGRWLGGQNTFGKMAKKAAKPRPLPRPSLVSSQDYLRKQVVEVVRGGGLETPSSNNDGSPKVPDVIDISKENKVDEKK
jgi:integrase